MTLILGSGVGMTLAQSQEKKPSSDSKRSTRSTDSMRSKGAQLREKKAERPRSTTTGQQRTNARRPGSPKQPSNQAAGQKRTTARRPGSGSGSTRTVRPGDPVPSDRRRSTKSMNPNSYRSSGSSKGKGAHGSTRHQRVKPGSGGKKCLPHEPCHATQQRGGTKPQPKPQGQKPKSGRKPAPPKKPR